MNQKYLIITLSRGAKTVVFIDEYYPSIKTIKMNLERCGAGEGGVVIRREI